MGVPHQAFIDAEQKRRDRAAKFTRIQENHRKMLFVPIENALRKYNGNYSVQRASDQSLLVSTTFGAYHVQITVLNNQDREHWPT